MQSLACSISKASLRRTGVCRGMAMKGGSTAGARRTAASSARKAAATRSVWAGVQPSTISSMEAVRSISA